MYNNIELGGVYVYKGIFLFLQTKLFLIDNTCACDILVCINIIFAYAD